MAEEQIKDGGDEGICEAFFPEELHKAEELLDKKRGLENQSMGLRYPIWFTAMHHRSFQYQLTAAGSAQKDSDYIKLASLSDPDSCARQAHPELFKLSDHIVKYLKNFHFDYLQIEVRKFCYRCEFAMLVCKSNYVVLFVYSGVLTRLLMSLI